MNQPPAPRPEPAADPGHRTIAYAVLITVAAGLLAGRLIDAPSVFSVNDASRWATIRALVDEGTYAIGRRFPAAYGRGPYVDRGIVSEPGWKTIDMVMHPTTGRFYSTKPTLLPTLLAGEYWLLREGLGWQITHHRRAVARTILFTTNWLPFLLYLMLFARLVERLGTTDWGRLFVFAAAAFGTFVSGFLATLNNHTVAAAGALFALDHCLRIALDGDRRWWRFALAGLFAGWTACNELPAASLAAAILVWLASVSPRLALRYALPALLLPVAGYLYTQYEAFGSVIPTYARTEWYQYEGSYWQHPVGVDRADESVLRYGFNLLAGHTGILSLTPVLLLGWMGMVRFARPARSAQTGTPQRELAWLALALTVITFLFYVVRTNNYGGVTAGPRWFVWLVPLWLLAMLPEADRWSRHRWPRALAYVLLATSVASALYALSNPWRHSWLFEWLRQWGMISY